MIKRQIEDDRRARQSRGKTALSPTATSTTTTTTTSISSSVDSSPAGGGGTSRPASGGGREGGDGVTEGTAGTKSQPSSVPTCRLQV